MAVTLDAVNAGGQVDASQSLTFSVTVANNANRLLLVGVSVGAASDGGTKPPTATFNGVSMNLVTTKQSGSDASTAGYAALFSLVAPAVTTANVVVDLNGTSTADIQGGAISLYGVDQTTPLGTAVVGNGNAQSQTSVTVTGVDSGNMAVNAVAAGSALSATNSHTDAWMQNNNAGTAAGNSGGQYASGSGADITMTWTITASEWWASIGVEVLASTGPVDPAPTDAAGLADSTHMWPRPTQVINDRAVRVGV